MLYENYKLEDMFFTNHPEEYTDEEVKEILSTFPETKMDAEMVEALEQLVKDIEDGVLKTNRYGDIHPSSAKKYATARNRFFGYQSESYRNYAGLYLTNDDYRSTIKSSYQAKRKIDQLKDDKQRLSNITFWYAKKEKTALGNREKESYEQLHADRIDQGLRTYEKMQRLEIDVAIGFDPNSYSKYSASYKRLYGQNYISHNRYGEITTVHDELLSEKAGKELEKALDELAKELTEIIDIYHGKFTEIIRNGKES